MGEAGCFLFVCSFVFKFEGTREFKISSLGMQTPLVLNIPLDPLAFNITLGHYLKSRVANGHILTSDDMGGFHCALHKVSHSTVCLGVCMVYICMVYRYLCLWGGWVCMFVVNML